MKIKIGTRKSKLALTQTNLVIDQIEKYFPNFECEIVPITTTGDLITNIPLYDIGGKALFLREIEQQLIDHKIDIAVHSLKDVPGLIPNGLIIAAVLERNDPHDAFVSFKYDSIESLPLGAKIGSSSVRRKVFLRNIRPDLNVVIFRGNVDSRMNKLKGGEVDAMIVAAAGLKRLNIFDDKYCHILSRTQMLPAVGQGVISLEIREDNLEMKEVCDKINHLSTWNLINAERAFLEYLNADCRTPLAAYASYTSDNNMRIEFMLSDLEGRNVIFHHENCNITASKQMAIKAAEAMSSRLNSK